MNVLVLGAGVIGLTTAQRLARDGHRVTVLDRRSNVALECSYANAGQLTYDFAMPMGTPGLVKNLPRWLTSRHSPVRVDLQWDTRQWAWILRFMHASSPFRSMATMEKLMALSAVSRDLMREFIAQHESAFDWRQSGKLTVYSTRHEFDAAQRLVARKRMLGGTFEILSREACIAREPALRTISNRLVSGVYAPNEDTADCHKFCLELRRLTQEPPYGVKYHLGTNVTKLITKNARVTGVETINGIIEADTVVLALGNDAGALMRPLGFEPMVYPVKGYSVTLPASDDHNAAPSISLTDASYRVVYSRLGSNLRVAGMADIGGRTADFTAGRLEMLVNHARQSFPKASRFETLDPWCGLRPCTPTGWPVLGRAPDLDNLYFNLGHGMLGFTLAMGSAQVVADLVAGRVIDPRFA